jgi:hypothetical protein
MAIALGYLMMTDRGETVPDSSVGEARALASDLGLDRPPSGGSGPVSTAKVETRAPKQEEEPVAADKLPESSPLADAPAGSSAPIPATTILDENLAMAYSSDPFGVLPSHARE